MTEGEKKDFYRKFQTYINGIVVTSRYMKSYVDGETTGHRKLNTMDVKVDGNRLLLGPYSTDIEAIKSLNGTRMPISQEVWRESVSNVRRILHDPTGNEAKRMGKRIEDAITSLRDFEVAFADWREAGATAALSVNIDIPEMEPLKETAQAQAAIEELNSKGRSISDYDSIVTNCDLDARRYFEWFKEYRKTPDAEAPRPTVDGLLE